MFEMVSEILYFLTRVGVSCAYHGLDISMALGTGMARRFYETSSMTSSSFIQPLAIINHHRGILRTRDLLTG